jgi:hypothetical protein
MERRRETRVRVLKAARILLNGHFSAISCTVRNLSEGGACLNVASTIGIPERFDLIFETDKTTRPCRMVWQQEQRLGVQFARAA